MGPTPIWPLPLPRDHLILPSPLPRLRLDFQPDHRRHKLALVARHRDLHLHLDLANLHQLASGRRQLAFLVDHRANYLLVFNRHNNKDTGGVGNVTCESSPLNNLLPTRTLLGPVTLLPSTQFEWLLKTCPGQKRNYT